MEGVSIVKQAGDNLPIWRPRFAPAPCQLSNEMVLRKASVQASWNRKEESILVPQSQQIKTLAVTEKLSLKTTFCKCANTAPIQLELI
jgi:hypothetical protein